MSYSPNGVRIRVLGLVPYLYDTAPGQRFRIEQWEPQLRPLGIDVDFQPFEDDELHSILYKPGSTSRKVRLTGEGVVRRLRLLRRVTDYDLIYLYREAALLGPPLLEYWLGRSGPPMIFDFDDAIFVPIKTSTSGHLSILKFAPAKTRTACRMSAHVMVGNRFLAEFAERYNKSVTVIPTTIDTDKYRADAPRAPDALPVIGWSGSHSTVAHLDVARSILRRLHSEERFRLKVIGTASYEIPGLEVEALAWSATDEVSDLRQIDIGIMPLPDDSWSRGKCGLKALQYMALGIPAVCSPVGVNAEIIQDGRNGFLASTDDEWIERLTKLLRSPDLRRRVGAAGRATVEQTYSAEAQVPRVAELIRSVARARR